MDRHFFNKTVWGLVMIGAGVLFLLNQTGAVNIDFGSLVAVYWPVILLFFGLKGIIIQRRLDYGWGGSYIWHVFLALLGTYFLLRNLGITLFTGVDLWQFVVPVLLILIGINMLGRGPGSKYEERKADRREQRRQEKEAYRQEREAYRQNRRQARMAYKEQRYREKMDRGFQPGGTNHEPFQPEGTEPVYDPNYTRKIEQDLDQAFHERIVKKMGDDPFPLVSQMPPEHHKAPNAETPPEGYAKGPGYGHMPPPPPPPKHWHAGWQHHGRKGHVVERSNFIGDIHLGQDYWELEPTNVSHFIGDTIIDLTKASIPYGETKVIVSSFIGDVKVFVPNDIQVEVSVTASAFIGDMRVMDRHEGGLFRHMKHDTPHYIEAEKKINLTVSMFIGDVFVKRVG